MRIEKINDNKLKIMFNSKELEENNITVHSFLSGSNEAQKLFLAILEIANEEFGFDTKDCNIFSETISLANKNFIIFVTKTIITSEDKEQFSSYNLLDFMDSNHTTLNDFMSFTPPTKSELELERLIYKFDKIEDVFNFCEYVNNELEFNNIENSLYKYNDSFFIIVELEKLDVFQKHLIISILSEYKNYIYLSPLAFTKFLEHSFLILNSKAIQSL